MISKLRYSWQLRMQRFTNRQKWLPTYQKKALPLVFAGDERLPSLLFYEDKDENDSKRTGTTPTPSFWGMFISFFFYYQAWLSFKMQRLGHRQSINEKLETEVVYQLYIYIYIYINVYTNDSDQLWVPKRGLKIGCMLAMRSPNPR